MSFELKNRNFTIEEVEDLFNNAITVKSSPVREVRRAGDYFIKFDRRSGHGFAKEYFTALRLQKAGLPVVDHLFHGKSANGNYLVTGSFADSIAVDDYLRDNVPEMSFFEAVADLTSGLLKKGFLHSDFHLGNLLFNTVDRTFALVDVRKVRSIPRLLLNSLPDSAKFHPLTEFRRVLRKSQLLTLFRRAGISSPGKFYEEMLNNDCDARNDEWKRRRKQILSGYAKFTRLTGDDLINVHASEADLANAVVIPGGKAVFLAGYYLDLIQIPHRKVVRYEFATDTTYAIPECSTHPGGEAAIEMMERLALYDIITAPTDWYQPETGLPHLKSLQRVAGEPLILKE